MGEYREAKKQAGRRSPRKLVEVSIKPVKAGGHIVSHHYERPNAERGYPEHEEEQHVFGAGESGAMMQHVAKHVGAESAAPEPEPEGEPAAAEGEE